MHIIAPHMICVVNMPLTPDEPNELQAAMDAGYTEIYVVTCEGVIKHHKLRGEDRYIRVKVNSIPNFSGPTVPQVINFLPAGKIPKQLFDQIVSFFYGVMERNGDKALEAMAHILWNPTLGYHIGIPPQKISAAAVTYDWSYITAGTSIVCDIHSHNNMRAFFSATDNNDDRANICFSGVVGEMNQTSPATVWRFNYQERKFEAKFEDIFDVAQAEAIPSEWYEQIEIPAVNLGRQRWSGDDAGKGRADHLKPYQFKRSTTTIEEGEEGGRSGPHVRAHDARGGGKVYGSAHDSGFDSLWDQPWHLGANAAERAFVDVTEDPVGGKSSGKELGKVGSASHETNDGSTLPWDDSAVIMSHDRWDELVVNNGEEAADAYCTIDLAMVALDKQDDLIDGLVSDMFQLASDTGQAKMIRSLFQLLSPQERERIEMTGI